MNSLAQKSTGSVQRDSARIGGLSSRRKAISVGSGEFDEVRLVNRMLIRENEELRDELDRKTGFTFVFECCLIGGASFILGFLIAHL